MAINPALLIAAPMLQDSFVSKDGEPLSNGIITLYDDSSRTTLKNWYYQTGGYPNYIYIALPNPLRLSAAGTICDANGTDTIPFFYPVSETDNLTPQKYFIRVENHRGRLEFTRENFPYNTNSSTSSDTINNDNYVINNRFWRNIGSITATTLPSINSSTGLYSTIIAPSQHDGFSVPDIEYVKNVNGATDVITFASFPNGFEPPLDGDITPEYYLNFTCTGTQAGETTKCFQFPVSLHVNTLDSVTATFTIQAQSVSGTAMITFYIYQFLGSGVASPAPIAEQTITLSTAWEKYIIPFTFPTTAGAIIGAYDNAIYMQIGLPLASAGLCNINIALPSIYLGSTVPTTNFQTYDQIDSIINTPRTGDIRTSVNAFYYFGWVPLNDGTIGYNPNSGASYYPTSRNNADTWPLYSLLWELFAGYNNGAVNLICPLFDTSGNPVISGASAIDDFNANKSMRLTLMMGRVIMGTVPMPILLNSYSTTFTASNAAGTLVITASNNMNLFIGMPIYFNNTGGALPTGIQAGIIYYVSNFNGTTGFSVSTTYANSLIGVAIAYTNAGSGTNTVTSSLEGSQTGQYAHTQLEGELAAHHHPGSTVAITTFGTGAGGGANTYMTTGSTTSVTVATDGSSAPFNIVQPATFYNMYMKL